MKPIISCPLCHSTSNIFKFYSQNRHGHHLFDTKNKFSVYQCLDCQTIFLKDVKVDLKYYRRYYQENYYQNQNNLFLTIYQKLLTKNKSKQLLKLFNSSHKIRILDIGCGDGNFLSSLSNKHFLKFGLDTSSEAVKICLTKNIVAKKTDITKTIPFPQQFDLITLNHVFEHLSDPQSALKNILSVLDSHGYLFITIPLCDSIGYRLGKKFWFHLDSPRHLFIPNLTGLSKYLKTCGLKILNISRQPFEFPLDLFWSLKNHPYYWPLLVLYPLIKFFDWETATFICQKN